LLLEAPADINLEKDKCTDRNWEGRNVTKTDIYLAGINQIFT
jgi:hypothetical protein